MDGNIRRKGFFLPPISTNPGSPNKGELKGKEVTKRELSPDDKRLLKKLQWRLEKENQSSNTKNRQIRNLTGSEAYRNLALQIKPALIVQERNSDHLLSPMQESANASRKRKKTDIATDEQLIDTVKKLKKVQTNQTQTKYKRRMEKVCSYLREQKNSTGKSASSFEFKEVGGVDCCEIPGVFIGSGAANTQLLAVDLTNERLCALSERVLQDPSSSAKSISLDSPYSSSSNNGYTRDSWSDSSPVSSSNSSPLTLETNFDLPTPSSQNSFGGLSLEIPNTPSSAGNTDISSSQASESRAELLKPQEIIEKFPEDLKKNNLVPTFTERTKNNFIKLSEYCNGGDAANYILKENNPKNLLKIATGILSGVSFLHSKGYVHRDLKLENVLIQIEEKDTPLALIGDFDSLLSIEEHQDRASNEDRHGITLAHAAPELLTTEGLWKKEEVGVASDLFSVGIVLAQIAKKITNGNKQETGSAKDLAPDFVSQRQRYISGQELGDESEVPTDIGQLQTPESLSKLDQMVATALWEQAKTLLSVEPQERGSADAAKNHLEALLNSLPSS